MTQDKTVKSKAAPNTTRKAATRKTSPKKKKTSGKTVKGKKKKHQINFGWKAVCGVVAFVLLFVCWPYIRSIAGRGDSVPKGDYDYCLDISHYQGKIQWDSLRVMTDAKGRTIKSLTHAKEIHKISYVYIKATEGEELKDKRFASYWEAAGKTDIWRGAYHFYRSSKDPVKQARNFISTVGKLDNIDLPPVLDIETMHDGCTRKQLNSDILKWLEIVEKEYGVRPIIYTSDKFLRDVLSSRITSKYKIWVAHYKTQSPWTDNWVMWQFTDAAYVCGIHSKADLSVVRFGEIIK